MRTLKAVFRLILSSAVLLTASCGVEIEPEVNEAPKVVSTDPENGITGVDYENSFSVTVTYDQTIRCSLADQSGISIDNGAKIKEINPDGSRLVISIGDLAPSSVYTLSVSDGIVKGYKENQDPAKGVALSFTTRSKHVEPTPDQTDPCDNEAWKQLERLGLGWNLGNQFDAFVNWNASNFLYPGETVWGNEKCTQATFTGLRAAGFSSVRIPITWLKMVGDAPEYKIDEAWMARIKEVVGWARDAGLNVIINTHHDEDHYYGSESLGHRWLNIMEATTDESLNAQIKDRIKGLWTNIANEFKNEGDYLMFEGFNEINDGKWGGSANSSKQAQVLNQWNQVFVDAVRATGGNNASRWISVPTYCASIGFIKDFTLPDDPAGKTMLAVHSYNPYNYTLAEGLPQKKWGHTFNNESDEKSVRDELAAVYNGFISKGIPAYLGEFGCSMREYNTSEWKNYAYYLEYFVKAAKSYGIPCFLWDNGNKGAGAEHHAYIDHATGGYVDHSKEVIDLMVNAMYRTDKEYTLQYVFDNAPRP